MRQTLFQSYNAISNNLLVSELPDSLITNAVILIRFLSQKGKTKKHLAIARKTKKNISHSEGNTSLWFSANCLLL